MGRKSWPGWPVALLVIVFAVWLGINGGYALAGWILDRPLAAPGLRDGRTLFIIVAISLVASTGFTLVTWARAPGCQRRPGPARATRSRREPVEAARLATRAAHAVQHAGPTCAC